MEKSVRELLRYTFVVQSDWAGKVIDLTEMLCRISEDFGDHPGDAESGEFFPLPSGIIGLSCAETAPDTTRRNNPSRSAVDLASTKGGPDQENTCSGSQCCFCSGLGVVSKMSPDAIPGHPGRGRSHLHHRRLSLDVGRDGSEHRSRPRPCRKRATVWRSPDPLPGGSSSTIAAPAANRSSRRCWS